MERQYYLAGPMSGYPRFNYPLFAQVANAMRQTGKAVVSPHELNPEPIVDIDDPSDIPVIERPEVIRRLRDDTRHLARCTDIVLLPGWTKSVGARYELQIALGLDMGVHYFRFPNILIGVE